MERLYTLHWCSFLLLLCDHVVLKNYEAKVTVKVLVKFSLFDTRNSNKYRDLGNDKTEGR